MTTKNFIISVFLFFVFLLSSLGLKAQGYNIKVNVRDLQFDSLYLQSFDTGGNLVNVVKLPAAKMMEIKGKKSLNQGMYVLKIDSNIVTEILISDLKSQSFTVQYDGKEVLIADSPENEANRKYVEKMVEFDDRLRQLDDEFYKMKQDNLPSYMMQPFIDSLTARALRIDDEKKAYQQKISEQYKDYLLGSIIQSTMEIPAPPREIYGNQHLMQLYMAEHLYDNYVWKDERLLNTPVGINKHKQFANLMYYIDYQEGAPIMKKVLTAAQVNEKSYAAFFEHMEKVLGATKSPYRVEGIYIEMLKNAIAYDKIDKVKKVRYEAELKHLDKNLDGSVLPNFNILLGNGDTTTLYDVKAPYMLVYFQHPECPTCREARTRMKDYPMLNKAIDEGKIVVLTVYFEKDKKIFDNYMKTEANPKWLHSWNYDNRIEKEELFYLITIPYMFLVDKDKRVIKKDILINEVEDYVKRLK